MTLFSIPVDSDDGLKSVVASHFGRAIYYAIYNDEDKSIKLIENTSSHRGGTGVPPELLKKQQVQIMLCGNLGRRAVYLFEDFGIEVFVGAQKDVETTIQLYKDNKLQMATDENACKEHHRR